MPTASALRARPGISQQTRTLAERAENCANSFAETRSIFHVLNMARFIDPPKDQLSRLRQPLTAGEQKVLEFLDEQLDQAWEIYIQPHLNGWRPDFVLLNPRVGIAVIEVKDWNLDAMRYFVKQHKSGLLELYGAKDGKDFPVDNPFTKVRKYQQAIFNLFCPRIDQKAGLAHIVPIVIFPFAARGRILELQGPFLDEKALENRVDWFPVGGAEDFNAEGIERILPLLNRHRPSVMRPGLADDLRGWLVEPDFASTQREPLALDKNQRDLAETRTQSGYRRIRGPAGSGKSLVLAARAANLASQGKSVLIVTYNMTLWHYLRDLVARGMTRRGWLENLTFAHFHGWCRRVCDVDGYRDAYYEIMKPITEIQQHPGLTGREKKRRIAAISPPILDEAVPRLAARAARASTNKYDAVLVDEGQDYLPLWWNALRGICRPGGEMILVADVTQDVYGTARTWTEEAMTGAGFSGGWAQLKIGYRSPSAAISLANDFANRFLPANTRDLPEPAQGNLDLSNTEVTWSQCQPADALKASVNAVLALHRKTGRQGLANADIIFLCQSIDFGLEFVTELTSYGVNVVHTYSPNKSEEDRRKMAFWMGDARMKATTFQSFKGWEARLLVVCISEASSQESRAAIYAALTRLKHSPLGSHLTVVCSAPELADFGTRYGCN